MTTQARDGTSDGGICRRMLCNRRQIGAILFNAYYWDCSRSPRRSEFRISTKALGDGIRGTELSAKSEAESKDVPGVLFVFSDSDLLIHRCIRAASALQLKPLPLPLRSTL